MNKLTDKQLELLDNAVKQAEEYSKEGHNKDETLKWFKSKVNTGKDWDFKNKEHKKTDSQLKNDTYSTYATYEYFGNYAYGYVGRVLSIDKKLLLISAGGQQAYKNPKINAIIDFLEILHGLSSIIDKNLLEIDALTSTSLMNKFDKRKKYGNNL